MSSSQLSVLRRGGIVAAALCLLLLAFHSAPPAIAMPAAPTFTVNSLFDVPADLADTNYSVCRTAAANSTCTLRAAIMKANRYAGGGVTIIVPAGVYTLTVAPVGADDDTTGDLNLTQSVQISGAGLHNTIIDANHLDRLFYVPAGPTVLIEGLTLQNGFASVGGAIRSQGTLTLTSVALLANHAQNAGGAVYSEGSLTISDSQITRNEANNSGGGLYLEYGSTTVDHTVISDNDAITGWGGGLFSRVGTLVMTASEVTGNQAKNSGGGLYLYATVIINNSTVNANLVRDMPFSYFGGGGIMNFGTLTINNSTISANSATGRGGGIHNDPTGTLQLFHVTVTGNVSDNRGGSATKSGGGLYLDGIANVWNSLLADNYYGALGTFGADCTGTLISHDYNYVQSPDGCSITGTTTHNLSGGDALLGPLGDFGGPTHTRLLWAGSPALDQIPANQCRDSFGTAPIPDQRGVARPINGLCDIGAYEGQSAPGLYNRNLIQNGDAESGGASPNGIGVGTPNWTQTTTAMSVVRYGIGLGFPDPAIDVVPTGHGYNFFAGGPWSFVSAVQTVTVSSISTAIDAGEVDYALAADLGGFQAYNDSPVVSYQFLNDANGTIGFAIMLGPATPSDRGSVTGFSHFSQAGTVPTGTRAIRITMSMTRGGSFNNGYVDNVELVLADPLRYVYLPLTLK